MDTNALPKVIVVAGTNASGKSALGIRLAKKYNGEIISADSRQIFRGFDLCCGKVTAEEMEGVPHHMLDVCEVGTPFSVTDYQKAVYDLIPRIIARGHVPFIVGGTGLYISAVVRGYQFKESPVDLEYRRSLEDKTLEELRAMLPPAVLAEMSANDSEIKNKRRVIRVLEKLRAGEDIAWVNEPRVTALQLGVTWPREVLARRIDERLETRLAQGMLEEVRQYLDAGKDPQVLWELGLEYRYILWYLTGMYGSEGEFRDALAQAIRKFSKRQMTWFRRDPDIHWLDMARGGFDEACARIEPFLG